MEFDMRLGIIVALGAICWAGVALADGPSPLETLGKSVFFDSDLSLTGTQSCASCHNPASGYSGPLATATASGPVVEGAVVGRFGNLKPPSLAYASESPVLHHIFSEGGVTFVGGAFLDGRATGGRLGHPTADQAAGPFLNPLEMALPDAACAVYRVLNPVDAAKYPVSLADIWGRGVPQVEFPADIDAQCKAAGAKITLQSPEVAAQVSALFDKIAYALAAYEASSEIDRFNSRYDAWLRGEDVLSKEELAGMKLFQDPAKGKCSGCHVMGPSTTGRPAVFTDWTFDNIGVPRNRENPFYIQTEANPAGHDYVDPGLGGYLKTDAVYAAYADENFGRHQVPTLRNLTEGSAAGLPRAYTHNGYFHTLTGLVHFYNTRDVLPRCADKWASEAEALLQNCWPAPEVTGTMNTDELGDLKLTSKEEAEIVAFLKTLDDQ